MIELGGPVVATNEQPRPNPAPSARSLSFLFFFKEKWEPGSSESSSVLVSPRLAHIRGRIDNVRVRSGSRAACATISRLLLLCDPH